MSPSKPGADTHYANPIHVAREQIDSLQVLHVSRSWRNMEYTRPESALFQATFEAVINCILASRKGPTGATDALILRVRQAAAKLKSAEGSAAWYRLLQEVKRWRQLEVVYL
jgi:hypothetical protein